MRGFVNGVVFTIALIVAAGLAALYTGALYAGADRAPSAFERWAARTSLRATISRETASVTVPPAPSDDDLLAGAKLYGANCAICHGAADKKASNIARGFAIRAPQFARHGVEDDPVAESYWKIDHGIRFTAMPAFRTTLTDRQIWQIAYFVKSMDKLPPNVDAAWKAMPSVADPDALPAPAEPSPPNATESSPGGSPAP